MADPITNYIPPAATVGGELWTEPLPIVRDQSASNQNIDVAVSPGVPYRVRFAHTATGNDNFWFIIREQTSGGGEPGFTVNLGGKLAASPSAHVYEFVTHGTTAKINVALFNLSGDARTLTISEFSVQEIEEVTPYIRLEYKDNVGGITGPAASGGETYVDVPVASADGGAFIRSRHVFGPEGNVLDMAYGTAETFPDDYSGSGYQNRVGSQVIATKTPTSIGNNDHIFSIIRPPATGSVEVVDSQSDDDDLLGNIHGNEVIRGAFDDNAQVWYDPIGDGTWVRLRDSNLTHFCKQVKIVINTRLYDADDVDRVESDHEFVVFAGGAIRCDRTDRFVAETQIEYYFYWMSSLALVHDSTSRRGHGATVDGELICPNSGDGDLIEDGYGSSWAVVRRDTDNVCWGMCWDLAHELAQPGITGFRTRLFCDPGMAAKVYTHAEFDAPVPADTEFTSRLWTFVYQPSDTTNFHAEMAMLGVEAPDTDTPPTITSASTKSGQVGTALSYTITATGSAPITYGASGLPAGLTVNTSTGAITGTPTTEGVTASTITATNSAGADSEALTFTIAAAPTPGPTSGNLSLFNQLAEAVGATGGHRYNLDALNAISQQLTGSAGHARNLAALNAIAGFYIGSPQSFTLNIDALNAITGKLGGASNNTRTVDALAGWLGKL